MMSMSHGAHVWAGETGSMIQFASLARFAGSVFRRPKHRPRDALAVRPRRRFKRDIRALPFTGGEKALRTAFDPGIERKTRIGIFTARDRIYADLFAPPPSHISFIRDDGACGIVEATGAPPVIENAAGFGLAKPLLV